jgi:hypothetical protein
VLPWLEKRDRNIYKFMSLPGDPSPEEQKKISEEQRDERLKELYTAMENYK